MNTAAAPSLLGAILVQQGKVRPEQLEHALQVQRASDGGARLGEVLVRLGYADEQDVHDALLIQRQMAEDIVQTILPAEERSAILLVCQDEAIEPLLRSAMASLPHNLVRVDRAVAARRAQKEDVEAVLWEVSGPQETVLGQLASWRAICPHLPLVVLLPDGSSARLAEKLLLGGADQVVVLPVSEGTLARAVLRSIARYKLQGRLEAQRLRLERMERVLAFLELLGQLLTSAPDWASLMTGLASGILSLLEAEVCLIQEGANAPVLAGVPNGRPPRDLPEGLQRVLESCRLHGEPINLDDIRRHPLWGRLPFDLPALRVHSLLCVPLCSGERSLGAIAVLNRLDGTAFSSEDQRVLRAIAGQATLALENVRLLGGTEQAILDMSAMRASVDLR